MAAERGEQAALDAFAAIASGESGGVSNAGNGPGVAIPRWTPSEGRHTRECEGCGSHVTRDFIRVFAGNDGVVHACSNCASQAQIARGAAADPDFEPDDERYQMGETL